MGEGEVEEWGRGGGGVGEGEEWEEWEWGEGGRGGVLKLGERRGALCQIP